MPAKQGTLPIRITCQDTNTPTLLREESSKIHGESTHLLCIGIFPLCMRYLHQSAEDGLIRGFFLNASGVASGRKTTWTLPDPVLASRRTRLSSSMFSTSSSHSLCHDTHGIYSWKACCSPHAPDLAVWRAISDLRGLHMTIASKSSHRGEQSHAIPCFQCAIERGEDQGSRSVSCTSATFSLLRATAERSGARSVLPTAVACLMTLHV